MHDGVAMRALTLLACGCGGCADGLLALGAGKLDGTGRRRGAGRTSRFRSQRLVTWRTAGRIGGPRVELGFERFRGRRRRNDHGRGNHHQRPATGALPLHSRCLIGSADLLMADRAGEFDRHGKGARWARGAARVGWRPKLGGFRCQFVGWGPILIAGEIFRTRSLGGFGDRGSGFRVQGSGFRVQIARPWAPTFDLRP